jgi:hypothetical protein
MSSRSREQRGKKARTPNTLDAGNDKTPEIRKSLRDKNLFENQINGLWQAQIKAGGTRMLRLRII